MEATCGHHVPILMLLLLICLRSVRDSHQTRSRVECAHADCEARWCFFTHANISVKHIGLMEATCGYQCQYAFRSTVFLNIYIYMWDAVSEQHSSRFHFQALWSTVFLRQWKKRMLMCQRLSFTTAHERCWWVYRGMNCLLLLLLLQFVRLWRQSIAAMTEQNVYASELQVLMVDKSH